MVSCNFFFSFFSLIRLCVQAQPSGTCHDGCYDHSSGLPWTIFFFYLIYPPFSTTHTYLLTTQSYQLPDPYGLTLRFYCSSLCIVSHLSFHTVDIPIAPFHVLLFTSWTPDLVPICLVIDRPLWMSL